MKTTIKFLLFIIIVTNSINLNAQAKYPLSTYTGVWEWQNGNEIFRVRLRADLEDNTRFIGHYEKVSVDANGNETFIYNSNKEVFTGNNKGWLPYVITGGGIIDNTVDQSKYHPLKHGSLKFEILTATPGNITARWHVFRKTGGIIGDDEAPEFSVPTDVILTKVN